MSIWVLVLALATSKIDKSFCQNNTEDQDWKLVFKIAAGGEGSVYSLYMNSTMSLNMDDKDAQTLSSTKHFKSEMLNQWDSLGIDLVKIAVIKNNEEKAFFVFNGQQSNKTNWFARERLLNTSYGDMFDYLEDGGYIFSIEGLASVDRRFYINYQHQGCSNDEGWLLVSEPYRYGSPICRWEHYPYITESPTILFSPANNKMNIQLISEQQNFADSLAIFVTMKSEICSSSCVEFCASLGIGQHFSTKIAGNVTRPSDEELQHKISTLKTELTVSRKNTTQYKRTLTSALDNRYSSKTMGIIGVLIIASVILFIVGLDCVNV